MPYHVAQSCAPLRGGFINTASEKGHKDRYFSSLLGGVPMSPTRFSAHELQVAVLPMSGVGVACLIPFTDHTFMPSAPAADIRAGIYGRNL